MIATLDQLIEDLARTTQVIEAHESALVDTRLARGRLWRNLDALDKTAMPELADELRVDLSVAKQERWLAGKYDAPLASWVDWTAHRDLASLDPDTRARLVAEAEAAGQATSAHLRRLAREEKARLRGTGPAALDNPEADPITATSRAALILARLQERFGADFDPGTIEDFAAEAERAVVAWEDAAAVTLDTVFGPATVAVEVGA